MGGLQAAFRQCAQELLWVSAVDMPLLSSQAVELLSKKRCHCEDACVFTHDGRPAPYPLGLYRSTCLPVIDGLLEAGENRMSALLDTVKATRVPLKNTDWVRNVNTPQELYPAPSGAESRITKQAVPDFSRAQPAFMPGSGAFSGSAR